MKALLVALSLAAGWNHSGNVGSRSAAKNPRVWSDNYSLSFAGDDDYVTFGQPSNLELTPGTSKLTIGVWFKRGAAADFERHLGGKATMAVGGQVGVVMGVTADEKIETLVYGGNNTNGGDTSLYSFGWHLSSLSVNGSTARLYLDGVQVGSTFAVGAGWNIDADWLIGATRYNDNTDSGYPFSGKIDEVTYWSDNFSDAEHAELYNSGEPRNPASHSRASKLIHYFPLGDGDTYPTFKDLVGYADGTAMNMAGAGNVSTDVPRVLDVLDCTGACDFQFVADDWSSGNWSARQGSWTAVKTGTPVKSASIFFAGRSEIAAWSSSDFFTVAANTAHTIHATDKVTYEWVLDNFPAVAGNTSWFGNIVTGNAGGLFVYANTSNRFDVEVANTSANAYLGGLTGASVYTTDKPVLVTMTVDVAAPLMKLYVNGTAIATGVWPDSSTSGVLTPLDCALGIGGRWSCEGLALQNSDINIGILEIVRHQRVLDATEIAARAAQFNTLKGY